MISEELERYISQVLSYASLIDSDLGHLRIAAFGLLERLAILALNPIPGPGLSRLIKDLRDNAAGRVLAENTDSLHEPPQWQMVFRYQLTVANEIEAMLTRCGESV